MRAESLKLLVNPGNDRIEITLQLPDGGKRNFTSAPKASVLQARDMLAEALEELSDQVIEGWDNLGDERREGTLVTLANAGKRLADVLFPGKQGVFVAAVEAHAAAARMISTILDPTLSIPWDFLRFESQDAQIFLGDFLTVSPDYLIGDDGDYETEYPVTHVKPRVGLIEDNLLSSSGRQTSGGGATGQELGALAQIVSDVSEIQVLSALDASSSRAVEIEKLYAFIGAARRVLHVNCHGTPGRDRKHRLRVANAFMVSSDDLAKRFDLYGALATLNVCNSGSAKYDSHDALSQLFHDRNAAAVVCTTGRVSDAFATCFAQEFYRRLATQDLLAAMNGARKALAEVAGHPMSFMYTFSGTAAFRVPFV